MDTIEKLQEKVSKDPSSKLFVPLAEEYRKAGRHDEAISVLKKGLEHQPGYMSARAALGKIYLEKDMKAEAREEFEKVTKAIPDNLFAQRKLADIYRGLGRVEEAARRYEIVLGLNPLDEEARSILEGLRPSPEKEAPPAEEPAAETAEGEEEAARAAAEIEALTRAEEPQEAAPPAEEGEEPFLEDLYGAPVDEDIFLDESLGAEGLAEEETSLAEEIGEGAGEPFAAEAPGAEAEEAWREEPAYAESVEEAACDAAAEEATAQGIAMEPDRDMEPPEAGGEIFFEEPVPAAAATDRGSVLREADILIDRGEYLGAMRLYKRFLAEEPYNKDVLQRVEELRALLKLVGRDGEIYEANLGSFLEGIKKRRDEFFGRP
ncbi:MAG: hypothetical protein Kow0025_22440 [Thermodesulfovibrionales bacterium]